MPKAHVLLLVVDIGATKATVCDLDDDLSRADLAVRSGFVNTLFASLEDSEVNHCESFGRELVWVVLRGRIMPWTG
jgi:hypothetical protein